MVQGDVNNVRGLEGLDIQVMGLSRTTQHNVDFARVPAYVQLAMEMVESIMNEEPCRLGKIFICPTYDFY